MNRAIPDIPRITAHWERRTEGLPYLMVPMCIGNGVEMVRFNPEIKQSHLKDALDKFTDTCQVHETGEDQ